MGINLNEIPDFNYLEPGFHDVKITKLEQANNPSTGNKGYKITVEDNGGATSNMTIWVTKNRGAEKNLIGIKVFLRKSGLLDQLNENEKADFSFELLKGKRLWVIVEKEEGRDGRMYSKIDSENGVFTDQAALEYGRKQHAAEPPAPQRQPAPAERPAPPAPQNGGEDDLPF